MKGRSTVLGLDHGSGADDRVGYLPEERGLYKKMKVRDILTFYAQLKGMRDCRRDIDDWLQRLDLAKWANHKVETLSKGMSQKVQFIATIVAQPKLVVLDEPFSGLDPVNMEVLKDAVVSLRDHGSTVIFSTHDMDVAERMCDTIFMIFRGQKVLDGSLESIQAQYSNDTIQSPHPCRQRRPGKPGGCRARQRLRPVQGTADGPRSRSAAHPPTIDGARLAGTF